MNHQKTIDGIKEFLEKNDLRGGIFLTIDKTGSYQHLTINLSAFETIGCLSYLADQKDQYIKKHREKEVELQTNSKPHLTPVN